ncbi:MAG: hypothetical protein GX131_05430 [candidate division WS1 bacterium]|nr:hypothetical protein [candidate division WS1 bacterium]
MPQFDYVARSSAGERSAGRLDAPDERSAAQALRAEGLFPLQVTRTGPVRWGASAWHHVWPVSAGSMALFFTQLAALLRSGVNAHHALEELSGVAADRRLRRVAREIAPELGEGQGLAEQMARYPALFPSYAVGLTRTGEQFGALPEVVASLAEQYETRERLHGRLKWMRLYYGAVLVLALLVPQFPWFVSRGMAWYGRLLATQLLPVLIGAVLVVYLLRALNAVPAVARLYARVTSALPLVGLLANRAAVLRALQALHLAQRAGATFAQALELAAEAAGLPRMHAAGHQAALRARRGDGLAQAMEAARFLPPRVRQMIAAGEHTGGLERALDAAVQWAAERQEASVNAISSGTAAIALAGSAVITLIALALAWRNFYAALFERAGV